MNDSLASDQAAAGPASSAFETALKGAQEGAADAMEAAKQLIPAAGRFFENFGYNSGYAVAYGVVFPAALIARLFPSDNPVADGLVRRRSCSHRSGTGIQKSQRRCPGIESCIGRRLNKTLKARKPFAWISQSRFPSPASSVFAVALSFRSLTTQLATDFSKGSFKPMRSTTSRSAAKARHRPTSIFGPSDSRCATW